jgi:ABC-type lipopolysaccharide export system ATPase subunit
VPACSPATNDSSSRSPWRITDPRCLILDEPTEGIQPSVVAEIEAAITALTADPP